MYSRVGYNGKRFIYFWLDKQRAINNDRDSKLFDSPFTVSPESAVEWRMTSRSEMIAPEALTYWNEE